MLTLLEIEVESRPGKQADEVDVCCVVVLCSRIIKYEMFRLAYKWLTKFRGLGAVVIL